MKKWTEGYLRIILKNGKELEGWADDLKIGKHTIFGRWRDKRNIRFITEDKKDIDYIFRDGVQVNLDKPVYNSATGLPQSIFDKVEGI